MEVEFGYVREYNTVRGFGFVSRTFKNKNIYQHRKGVWFHITKVKSNYPDLARDLDAGSYVDVSFWYEIDNSEGEKVSTIWLDSKDIPDQQRNDLVTYIEQLWRNIDNSPSQWLDQVTLALLGQLRKDELNKDRNDRICERKAAEEEELREIESQLGQFFISGMEFRTPGRLGRRSTIRDMEPERVYIGLPEHLNNLVLWVSRKYRKNRLSHIPGGSDVIVEYHDGRAFGYDWIKKPSIYIGSFFAGIVEYASDAFNKLDENSQMQIAKRKIARIFARKYNDDDEYSTAAFVEVWNSETSNEMPWKSLERFEVRQQNQDDFDED
ncbi:hypothetical protein Cri9333_4440 [Crinalium epipsammum PCC 9333]|uniref:CSD domain-containing protein n=1 Tax=Crinalium epipsammum PCC 9333 TaxID=1173022 RepID=K9W4D8_9CYAN|nr:hypothetical protein [Crinalium epipsammum]AFZ15223.1 hypothetical protein Cri9333_4440 [Crinalium epipsammum PCC 9333]